MQRESTLRTLWKDDLGLVISVELIFILTIGVLLLIVGLHAVTKATNYELGDLAAAIGATEQSYSYDGFANPSGDLVDGVHAGGTGTAYSDERDDCDCAEIEEVSPTAKVDGANSNVSENAP